MENAAGASLGQGGALTELAGKLTSAEAFITVITLMIGYGLWKVWGEMKHLLLAREHTAEKRNAEIAMLQNQCTKLEGMINSHFQIHLGLDKNAESATGDIKELKERFARVEGKLDILLERSMKAPRLPK